MSAGTIMQLMHGPCWEIGSWVGWGEGRHNEDYAVVSERGGCAALVDGATGLTKANIVEGTSDAAWYARELAGELVTELDDPCTSVEEAFPAAGERVAGRFRALPGADALQRIDEPNGSVAVLRWVADTALVALLGDCTAALLMRDGSVRSFHDDTLTKLDEANYERMYAYACSRNTTMAEARKALNPRFIENRLKMNEPGGYWAADISCRGMRHFRLAAVPLGGVAGVFACTDGYAAAVDMGVTANIDELVLRVAAGEGGRVADELRAAEQADAGLWWHHRSKVSDDATYLYVWLDAVSGELPLAP